MEASAGVGGLRLSTGVFVCRTRRLSSVPSRRNSSSAARRRWSEPTALRSCSCPTRTLSELGWQRVSSTILPGGDRASASGEAVTGQRTSRASSAASARTTRTARRAVRGAVVLSFVFHFLDAPGIRISLPIHIYLSISTITDPDTDRGSSRIRVRYTLAPTGTPSGKGTGQQRLKGHRSLTHAGHSLPASLTTGSAGRLHS